MDHNLEITKKLTELTTERALYVAMFALILIGLAGVSTWAIITYTTNILLRIAGIALSWGVILVVLFVAFQKLGWEWWS